MDEETFEQRYTPGGFANASKAARFLRELTFGSLSGITDGNNVDFNAIEERAKDKGSDPEPNYDPSDPMTIITYNQQNQVAGKLIGIFANQNTNHAFASLMQAFYLKKPIAFGEHPEGLSDMLHKTDYEAIDLNVAEFLAASVDAVKDPVLNFLNLNTVTADAGAVLARLGYSTRDIGLLFNQPIIKEICEYKFNNGVSVEVALSEILSQYKVDASEAIPEANPSTDLSSAKLASNIVKSRKAQEAGRNVMEDSSFRTSQLQVAQLFADILRVSGEVSQFVTSSKFTASNAVGSTFGDSYSQQMKVSKYLDSFAGNAKNKLSVVMEVSPFIHAPINNDPTLELSNQEYIERTLDNPFAYEQAMYDMNRRVSRLLSSYYPYDTSVYTLARSRMAELTKSGTLDADTINSIHSDMMVYLLAQQEDSLFNGDVPAKDGIPAREYYTKHFAKILFNTLESNPSYKSLPIFQYMQFDVNEESEEVNANIQDIGGLAPYQKDEIRESWAELMEETPDLARDLFLYNYYKLGFTFSPLAFMNLAPTKVKQAIKVGKKSNDGGKTWEDRTYVDFLNDVLKGNLMDKVDINNFVEQYVRNHTDNRKLVFSPTGTNLSFIKKEAIKNKVVQSTFTLDVQKLGEDKNIWLLPNSDKSIRVFRPFLMIEGVLYMADNSRYGDFKDFNISNCDVIEYRKVSKLGDTNKSLQYLSNSNSESKYEAPSSPKEGSTAADPEGLSPKVPEFDKTPIIKEIVSQMIPALIKQGFIMQESASKVKEAFQEELLSDNRKELEAKVKSIRDNIKKYGLLVLDEKGNPKPSC